MLEDYLRSVYTELGARRASYADKLVRCSKDEHDSLAATVRAYDEITKILRQQAQHRTMVDDEVLV